MVTRACVKGRPAFKLNVSRLLQLLYCIWNAPKLHDFIATSHTKRNSVPLALQPSLLPSSHNTRAVAHPDTPQPRSQHRQQDTCTPSTFRREVNMLNKAVCMCTCCQSLAKNKIPRLYHRRTQTLPPATLTYNNLPPPTPHRCCYSSCCTWTAPRMHVPFLPPVAPCAPCLPTRFWRHVGCYSNGTRMPWGWLHGGWIA